MDPLTLFFLESLVLWAVTSLVILAISDKRFFLLFLGCGFVGLALAYVLTRLSMI